MKRFFIALFALAATLTVNAQWLSGSLTQGYTRIDDGAGKLAYLQLTDTSGTNNPVVVYDNDSTTVNTQVFSGYTARQYYTTNIVRTYTDSRGVTVLRTNTVLFNAPLTVAAATNTARIMYTITVPANGSVVIEPPEALGYTYGFAMTNNGTLTYNARIISQD